MTILDAVFRRKKDRCENSSLENCFSKIGVEIIIEKTKGFVQFN